MSTPRNWRITIEFEAGTDPIRGRMETPDGDSQSFWGWLELIEALSRVAAEEPDPS